MTNADRDTTGRNAWEYRELQAHERDWMLREIALGEKTQSDLARLMGRKRTDMSNMMKRQRRRIDEIRSQIDNEFGGLWIARKRARIAELQEMAEILGEAIMYNPDPDMIRTRAALLKQASEELGQLPPRQQVVSANVSHTIAGITTDELRDLLS